MENITKEKKLEIIDKEILDYAESLYRLKIRAKLAKELKNFELEKTIYDDMEKCQQALDLLGKEREQTEKESK